MLRLDAICVLLLKQCRSALVNCTQRDCQIGSLLLQASLLNKLQINFSLNADDFALPEGRVLHHSVEDCAGGVELSAEGEATVGVRRHENLPGGFILCSTVEQDIIRGLEKTSLVDEVIEFADLSVPFLNAVNTDVGPEVVTSVDASGDPRHAILVHQVSDETLLVDNSKFLLEPVDQCLRITTLLVLVYLPGVPVVDDIVNHSVRLQLVFSNIVVAPVP